MTAAILTAPRYAPVRRQDKVYGDFLVIQEIQSWRALLPSEGDENARQALALEFTPTALADRYEDSKNVLQSWSDANEITWLQKRNALADIATIYRTLIGISLKYQQERKRTGYAWREF